MLERSQLACPADFENLTHVIGPANGGGPVEVAVGALHQPCVRSPAVNATRLRAKAVEGRQPALRGNFEHSATAVTDADIRSIRCRAIEVYPLRGNGGQELSRTSDEKRP